MTRTSSTRHRHLPPLFCHMPRGSPLRAPLQVNHPTHQLVAWAWGPRTRLLSGTAGLQPAQEQKWAMMSGTRRTHRVGARNTIIVQLVKCYGRHQRRQVARLVMRLQWLRSSKPSWTLNGTFGGTGWKISRLNSRTHHQDLLKGLTRISTFRWARYGACRALYCTSTA